MRLFIILSLFWGILYAHQYRCSYLSFDFNSTSPTLKWEIETLHLERKFNLDNDKNGVVSWRELINHKTQILEYIQKYFSLKLNNKEFDLNIKNFVLKDFNKQTYIIIDIALKKKIKKIDINYNLFFKEDSIYRCFVKFIDHNSTSINTLFSLNQKLTIEVKQHQNNLLESLKEFLIEGIYHIWIGIDHILFLLMLIIPTVRNREKFKPVFMEILKIVTAFSLAHSITLTLSALDLVSIPSKFIEVTIAISVLLTAINNIFEKIKNFSWQIAFGFGLIHGFGFANALSELELVQEFYVYLLAIFNIGIEFGQLAIVVIILPLLFILRKSKFYLIGILKIGSITTALLAMLWIFQRI